MIGSTRGEVGEPELEAHGEYEQSIRLRHAWAKLREELATSAPFFAGEKSRPKFEDALQYAARYLEVQTLYRARPDEGRDLSPSDMGPPPADKATPGRVNSRGVAVLYLASTETTAVSELRPHVGDGVWVGTFSLRKVVRLADLRAWALGSYFAWGQHLHQVLRAARSLEDLGGELSKPVSRAHSERDYLPTQYLCELIRRRGLDGVAYNSGVSPGFNVALFDPTLAECTTVKRVRVSGVSVTHEDQPVRPTNRDETLDPDHHGIPLDGA